MDNTHISLHTLQQQFTEAILAPLSAEPPFMHAIHAPPAQALRRIRIYHHAVFGNYFNALQAIYPVIYRLVGEGFFQTMATHYIRAYPSNSGDLYYYGQDLPDFLTTYTPAADLIYLPDTARLELAYHHVFHAAENAPPNLAGLQTIPPTEWETLRFTLAPTARLLQSPYPIHRIWQVNQPDYTGDMTVSLTEGEINLLIIRTETHITLEPLTPAAFTFLNACAHNHPFKTVCEQTLATDPHADISQLLQTGFLRGILVY